MKYMLKVVLHEYKNENVEIVMRHEFQPLPVSQCLT